MNIIGCDLAGLRLLVVMGKHPPTMSKEAVEGEHFVEYSSHLGYNMIGEQMRNMAYNRRQSVNSHLLR